MPSTTRPTLLTLPREIRDEIYSYLHKPLNLFHRCIVSEAFPIRASIPVWVRCEDAPLINIQLAHSRLRDAYRSTLALRGCRATVTLRRRLIQEDPEKRLNKNEFETMLAALKHVTFLVDADWWHRQMSGFVASKCTRLESLRYIAGRRVAILPKKELTTDHLTVPRGLLPDDATRVEIGKGVTLKRTTCGLWLDPCVAYDEVILYKLDHITMQLYIVDGGGRSPWEDDDSWTALPASPYFPKEFADTAGDEQKKMVERSSRLLFPCHRNIEFEASVNCACAHDPLARA